jgi:hypothetical protein
MKCNFEAAGGDAKMAEWSGLEFGPCQRVPSESQKPNRQGEIHAA